MSKNHIEKVAIVGAGGTQGKHIVEHLLKGKFEVTAVTREDSTNTIASGVKIAKVNYNRDCLVAALKGHDVLIITMNVMAPPETQSLLVKAAADAAVPWVLPNEWGEHSDSQASKDVFLGHQKTQVRSEIEKLGKSSWIGIASGFWYEFSLSGGTDRFGFDFNKRTVRFLDGGSKAIDVSTWSQVARAVTRLLELPITSAESNKSLTLDRYRNKFVHVKSFTLTQRQMFESVQRVTGTKESDWQVSDASAQALFGEGNAELKSGNRRGGFVKLLYSRAFFPDDAAQHTQVHGNDAQKLGVAENEDLDSCTKFALELHAKGEAY